MVITPVTHLSLSSKITSTMNIYNYTKNKILQQSCTKRFTCTCQEFQKYVQVTVLGAHTPLGRFTSFLLKQNPLVSVLRLQGDSSVKNIAADLSFIDTKCKVLSYEGSNNIAKSIRSSDIVLLLSDRCLKENTTVADRILTEGKRVCEIARECTNYAPRSIIIVAAPPVSVTTVLVELIYKQTHWYHPGRILGSAAIAQIRANNLMGRSHDLDPQICNVPIIGGPDLDVAVPLFSKASPLGLPDSTAKQLLLKYRGVKEHEFPKVMSVPNYLQNCETSEAFALWNMISTVALGLCGNENAYYNAYVRSNLINTCKHLVTTVQLSRGGYVHNCGIPRLTKLELQVFERAALEIKKREDMAKEFLEYYEAGRGRPPSFKMKELEEKKVLQQKMIS